MLEKEDLRNVRGPREEGRPTMGKGVPLSHLSKKVRTLYMHYLTDNPSGIRKVRTYRALEVYTVLLTS